LLDRIDEWAQRSGVDAERTRHIACRQPVEPAPPLGMDLASGEIKQLFGPRAIDQITPGLKCLCSIARVGCSTTEELFHRRSTMTEPLDNTVNAPKTDLSDRVSSTVRPGFTCIK